MTEMWKAIVSWVEGHVPFYGKDWISPVAHAFVTVLGLMPYPLGPLGIAVWVFTGWPWLWLAASTWTWGWYLLRELLQHNGRIPWKLDPLLDVAVPFVGLVVVWVCLLS